ncbi:heparinase II/III family protein [Hymenobacter sp. 5516J-16]|uniref:heparinase II/III domain-containing protein n=1 Tax=Hymenobacter sp. 5516J-16 TaxID=2932253 RepID=UPI001FD40E12|nr:heparinase II/III family protein [Hymenobacter sp. 5516J-16]UOQ76867.1 heparinase II/III family protein [Hymenobacter sp. 5516J-16]
MLTAAAIPAGQEFIAQPANLTLYESVYGSLAAGLGSENSSADGRRARATFAKNAAFVLLMDRKPDAGTLTALLTSERTAYQQQVVAALESLNPAVEAFASFSGTTYTEWQWRSKELIDYLIAYDLLRGTGVPESQLLVSKAKLQQFAGNLYRESNRAFLGVYFYRQVKNNHTLMTAAALGMAAVVLNDATSLDINQQPVNWINAGLFHIDNVLWEDAQRQSDPATLAGYAEGPYYFKYAFLNCLPFFRALGNFAPDANFSCTYNGTTRSIRNPYFDPRYDQLYEWITAILMPDGLFPALEDSYVDMGMPELALTGKSRYVVPLHLQHLAPGQLNSLTAQLRDVTVDMRAAYLAAQITPTPRSRPTLTHLPHSGNLVLQAGPDSAATYLHLYGKSGAVQTNSGGHNQADATSFILHAQGQLLALDAGYLSFNRRAEVGQAANHNLVLIDGAGPAMGTAGAANEASTSLPRAFAAAGLAFGEARTTYQNATVTRKVLFIRNRYYLLADFVQSAAPRRYTWQLHGYGLAGGTAQTGTFQSSLAQHEGSWEKNGARLQAHIATPSPAATYRTATGVHELVYNTPENHTTLLVDQSGAAQTQFLAALYPGTAAATPAHITTTSTAATAALTTTTDGFRDAAFTQSDTVLTTNSGLTQTISSDALLTFLSVDDVDMPVQAFLDQGTQLRYGSHLLLQSTRRVTMSWQQTATRSFAGYVSGATTLRISLPSGAAVTGPGVTASSFNAATGQLVITFSQASSFEVQVASRPLPVELTFFGARRQGAAVELSWQTATELQNQGFAVQRSLDAGRTFQLVAFVTGRGTSTQAATYRYTDKAAPATPVHYRLQQQDLDGTAHYSAVVRVAGATPAATLTAAPVPARDVLTVSFPDPSQLVHLHLLDSQGRVVVRQQFQHQTQLHLQALPAGLYYLRALNTTGQLIAPAVKVLVEK